MNGESLIDVLDGISFATDCSGTINAIGTRNWNAFACANDTLNLDAAAVIGSNLFDHISGNDVQSNLRNILQRLSVHPDCSWAMFFHCDAPDVKRRMRQSVRPIFTNEDCNGFLFQSIELDIKRRPPIDLFDFKQMEQQHAENKNLPLVTMCSWCQRVRFDPISNEWLEAESYYSSGGKSNVRLTHSICEPCLSITENSHRFGNEKN